MRRGLQWLAHRWFLMTRAVTLGVRAVVLDGEAQVLLVKHTYTPGWHLPGGGVEVGETVLVALAKELAEEAGVTVHGLPALHGVFFNARISRRDHVAVFVVRDFGWSGPPAPNREISAARFFPLAGLPADTTEATRRRLAEVLDDAPVSATW
ncbi:MAG: NUDIX domain-containing protein [Beijerinckiaceae bacterium]|jgi:8-oxo-dGTP pyrophosphatase MutT (NUDIX family)|nr:NUDIX domain-containing protein [Beijerinckiaceae bacterium]